MLTEPASALPLAQGSRLLLTPREAAKALSVCEKTLWSLTKRGELPAVRIGRAKRYALADIQDFINRQKENRQKGIESNSSAEGGGL